MNNILDIKDNFDIFLFDAYGVFWDGSSFYEGSKETMKQLVDEGKIVYILSNTTQISIKAEEKYSQKGLLKNIHYHEIITSGETTRNLLLNNKITFKSNKNNNIYVVGKDNKDLFIDTNYNIVQDKKDADFVYLSAQFFSNEEYEKMSEENKKYLVELSKSKGDNPWRATDIIVLKDKIQEIIDLKLPVLSSNPDYKALEGVVGGDKEFIITQGSIVKVLKENNVEVIEIGKPHKEIYDFTFSILEKNGINIDKSRTCMIGDTLRTDINGGNAAGVKTVLCLETGVTANEIKKGNNLEDLIKAENVVVDYIIKGVAINN